MIIDDFSEGRAKNVDGHITGSDHEPSDGSELELKKPEESFSFGKKREKSFEEDILNQLEDLYKKIDEGISKGNISSEAKKKYIEQASKIINLCVNKLPAAPLEKWKGKKHSNETPIDFLYRVWGNHLKEGVLYQSVLKKVDLKLYKSIEYYCSKSNLKVSDFIPSSEEKTKKEIEDIKPVFKEAEKNIRRINKNAWYSKTSSI